MLRRLWLALVGSVALLGASCVSARNTVTIQGCGATFPAPLYKRWFLEYYRAQPTVRTNYQAIGSGAGVQQLEEGLVHFGASDEPLKKDRLEKIARALGNREGKEVKLLQLPMTAGGVAFCYNVPEIGNAPLHLTRKAYVGILLGEITTWDHPQIQNAPGNKGLSLPARNIIFVHRADSSGTTFVFTNHLNAVDPRWKHEHGGPGKGKSVEWPVGIGGRGNAGVAALIQQTPGAIGYIESGYARLTGLPMAHLENRSGNSVEPTEENCEAALAAVQFDSVLGGTVPDPRGENAYPIVSMTWVICRTHYDDPRVGKALYGVLSYCLGDGQKLSKELGYAPLPGPVLRRVKGELEKMEH